MKIRQNSKSGFTKHLGRTYFFYTVGFAAFIVVFGILEKIGVPNDTLGILFVGSTLLVYACIGVMSRTMQVSEFFVAGRQVPAIYNGMATAADWISGTAFMALAGTLYLLGYDGLAFVLGWTGGFVLLTVLIAPHLNRFGAYTVPEFIAMRFGGGMARFLGVLVLLAASFVFLVAQIQATGLITERFLGLSYEWGIAVGIGCMVLCSLLGGMRAVTWTQAAQFIVLIIAYLIPVAMMSYKVTGVPVPQIMYGEALRQIADLEQHMQALGIADAGTLKEHLTPYTTHDPLNFFALIVCLMVGTASLPHILVRSFTTSSQTETRKSFSWSLLFIVILFITAPAYAAFAKLEIYETVIGRAFVDLPDWIYAWGENSRVTICGAAAISLEAVTAACQAAGTDVVRLADFAIESDVVVIATPEIAGLPYVITGLVGAGALAAILSTADGLLLAMANALSHDLYYKMLDRNAPTGRRLLTSRILLLAIVGGGAYTATLMSPDIMKLIAWAFSIAAAGNFPVLVLGLWWSRCTNAGALAGMLAGFAVTLAYIIYSEPAPFGFGHPLVFGIKNISAGIFGLPVGFAVMIGVSLLTRLPSEEMQKMVRFIRRSKDQKMTNGGSIDGAE